MQVVDLQGLLFGFMISGITESRKEFRDSVIPLLGFKQPKPILTDFFLRSPDGGDNQNLVLLRVNYNLSC